MRTSTRPAVDSRSTGAPQDGWQRLSRTTGSPSPYSSTTPVLDDPKLVDGATAALRLAVTNARMRAEVRARTAGLAASRRRIVEAADAQRRAQEAELATGAQRHLAQAGLHLAALETEAGDELRAVLAEVRAEVATALRELAQFAQGVRPQSLTAGGLGAALPLLAGRAGLPVSVAFGVGRLPPPVEAAAGGHGCLAGRCSRRVVQTSAGAAAGR
ncbi:MULTISPECIES: hypothetical protein [unclassified Streptomyces]|uniref:hypothetical protein n=1 Tax=unclassified Streptomyces TaxID=2593676 RepID=UPI002E800F42|nr:hypothetical protein [Streptomyces sp. NBC_00589]WTI41090.1 hypothetical protein OIC96_41875 [Streptomyces sp. NBC_00775]WUB25226.1 hypothetical protein OHA51_07850 [Streptomyces sp. NBC_00589]